MQAIGCGYTKKHVNFNVNYTYLLWITHVPETIQDAFLSEINLLFRIKDLITIIAYL